MDNVVEPPIEESLAKVKKIKAPKTQMPKAIVDLVEEPLPKAIVDLPKAIVDLPKAVVDLPKAIKAKRIPNQAQLDGLAKGRAARDANVIKKREEQKKVFEEKIIKKALSIKKKQVNKSYALAQLDDVSDDETPIEEIKQKHRAMTPPPVRILPQVIQTPIQPKVDLRKTFTFL